MPLHVKGKNYPLPHENNEPGISGRELIEIEEHFGLDGRMLMATFAEEGAPRVKGYTKTKALFALAWVSLTRGGEVLSLDDVLNDYALEDFLIVADDEAEELGKETDLLGADTETE